MHDAATVPAARQRPVAEGGNPIGTRRERASNGCQTSAKRYNAGMSTAYATEADFIKKTGGLATVDIARATGADQTTVRAWVRGTRSPSGLYAERLSELSAIIERLSHVLRPEFIRSWLIKPIVALDDDKPLDVIRAGEYRRVSRVVSALEGTAVS